MDLSIHENIESLRRMTKALETIKSPASKVFVNAATTYLKAAIRGLEKERSTPKLTTAIERVTSAVATGVSPNIEDVASVVDELATTREKLSVATTTLKTNLPSVLRSTSGVLFSSQGLGELLKTNHELRLATARQKLELDRLNDKLAEVPEVGRTVRCPSDGETYNGQEVDTLRLTSRERLEYVTTLRDKLRVVAAQVKNV